MLMIDINYRMDDELKERAEAEGGRERERGGREKKEGGEGGGEGEGGTEGLIRYLGEVEKWGELKIFRMVKEAWWIIKE